MSNTSTSVKYLPIDHNTSMNELLQNRDNLAFLFPVTKHCIVTLAWITAKTGIVFDNPKSITDINDVHRIFKLLATLMQCVGAEQILAFGTSASPYGKTKPKTTVFKMIGDQDISTIRKSLPHWNNCRARDYSRALSFASEFAFCAGKWVQPLLNDNNSIFTNIEFLTFYLNHYMNKNIDVADFEDVNDETKEVAIEEVNEEVNEKVNEEVIEEVVENINITGSTTIIAVSMFATSFTAIIVYYNYFCK